MQHTDLAWLNDIAWQAIGLGCLILLFSGSQAEGQDPPVGCDLSFGSNDQRRPQGPDCGMLCPHPPVMAACFMNMPDTAFMKHAAMVAVMGEGGKEVR